MDRWESAWLPPITTNSADFEGEKYLPPEEVLPIDHRSRTVSSTATGTGFARMSRTGDVSRT